MRIRHFLLVSVLWAGVGLGCGTGAYDAAYDCEQTIACNGGGDMDQCVRNSEAIYKAQEGDVKKQIEDTFERCKSMMGCDYLQCATGQSMALRAMGL